jgi:dTDP-4-amino-4,6-dideoxygalactose transaminase
VYDIEKYAEILKEKNIDIIEDVAQSFQGPEKFNGTPNAVLTMFSLGNIKIQTCFFGGISVVRDHKLYDEMYKIQETYP